MKNKLNKALFVLGLFLVSTVSVNALTISNNFYEDGQSLVNKILGDGLTATNVIKKGAVYQFSNGLNDVGIESGIILDTSGYGPDSSNDSDLAALMDYPYGGDTASLEFTMIAEGTLLNFNYVFASDEFHYGPQFNDVFGLFVSVNGGPYENIAILPIENSQPTAVNITNLKNNPSLYTAKTININDSTDGVSNVFNAQKVVKKGDTVKVKFVIADVSDTAVNSFVMIESGSLSFNPPGAKLNYTDESLQDLDPNTVYKIIDGDDTYEVTSDDEGKVPLVGKDNDNKSYNFIGKEIQIIKKGIGEIPDSDPQDIVIDNRPDIPDEVTELSNSPTDISVDDVIVTENSITIVAEDGQEYSLDGKNWKTPDNNGKVVFKDLQPNKEYTVYTRYAATSSNLASLPTSGTKILTKNMVKNLDYTIHNYDGEYDENYHYAYVGCDLDVDIKYSKTLEGTYTSDPIKFKRPGEHVVYYSISKEGYYTAYGELTVKITGKGIIDIVSSEDDKYNSTINEDIDELIDKIEFTEEELEVLETSKNIGIYLEVNDIGDSISKEEKELIKKKLDSSDSIGIYLDVSLFKRIDGEEATKISKTKEPIKISFEIPKTLINNDSKIDRKFKIFRVHDGKVDVLEVTVNGNIGTFETDEFSTYALAYADTKLATDEIKEIITNNPKTGDNVITYVIILAVSAFGIIGLSLYFKKKNKKDTD